jgi:hypothetical protein
MPKKRTTTIIPDKDQDFLKGLYRMKVAQIDAITKQQLTQELVDSIDFIFSRMGEAMDINGTPVTWDFYQLFKTEKMYLKVVKILVEIGHVQDLTPFPPEKYIQKRRTLKWIQSPAGLISTLKGLYKEKYFILKPKEADYLRMAEKSFLVSTTIDVIGKSKADTTSALFKRLKK